MTILAFLLSFALDMWVVHWLHRRVSVHGWEPASLRILFLLGATAGVWLGVILGTIT